MTRQEREVIRAFAGGDQSKRADAVAIYRRWVGTNCQHGDTFYDFLSEIDNVCPDYALRAKYRAHESLGVWTTTPAGRAVLAEKGREMTEDRLFALILLLTIAFFGYRMQIAESEITSLTDRIRQMEQRK